MSHVLLSLQLWEQAVRSTSEDVARIAAVIGARSSAAAPIEASQPLSRDSSPTTNSSFLSTLNTSGDFATMRTNLVAGVAKVRQRLRQNMSSALRKVRDKVSGLW